MTVLGVRASLKFGSLVGAAIAVATTIAMTLWDWIDNPSGIFRGAEGTNWDFVIDTAVSWIIPTFILAALIAFLGHLLLSMGRRSIAAHRRSAKRVDDHK